jgi:hypothetical protein
LLFHILAVKQSEVVAMGHALSRHIRTYVIYLVRLGMRKWGIDGLVAISLKGPLCTYVYR